jgi:6-phosphogluconate dehydrogenase
MQLIAETYDVMKRGLGLSEEELHRIYAAWSHSELGSFLLQITADIFTWNDPKSGRRLIDLILDSARQKGTGKWAAQEALHLRAPSPTLDVAVAMRHLSLRREERRRAAELLEGPSSAFAGDRDELLPDLYRALHSATLLTFAQGMSLLRQASVEHQYHFKLAEIARLWRGGSVIRSTVLERIEAAYRRDPELANLLLDSRFATVTYDSLKSLRNVAVAAIRHGIPVPGLASAISYYDAYRSARLPMNLTQAQRNYFGGHAYERSDGQQPTTWQ